MLILVNPSTVASTNSAHAGFPTRGLPNVTAFTSASGIFSFKNTASSSAIAPPSEWPTAVTELVFCAVSRARTAARTAVAVSACASRKPPWTRAPEGTPGKSVASSESWGKSMSVRTDSLGWSEINWGNSYG